MKDQPLPSRRMFLAALPVVTAGLAAAPSARAEGGAQPRWGMLIDTRRCIGCSMENALPVGQFRTTVATYAISTGSGRTAVAAAS